MSVKMNQLSTDAWYSSAHHVDISRNTITKNSIAIREIQLDDLYYLEKDLAFNEKVKVFLDFEIVQLVLPANKYCQCVAAAPKLYSNAFTY